jgi:hypothetical protein
MGIELIAAIIAAFVLGGMAFGLRKMTKGALPKWTVPAAAGVGLLGFTLWSEYDWYARVSAELPPGMQVVWQEQKSSPARPWTYLVPLTTRFDAMDTANFAQHPANPALRMARIYSFARWQNVKDSMMVFDCAAHRQITVTAAIEITPEGTLKGGDWVTPAADDGYQAAACVTQ